MVGHSINTKEEVKKVEKREGRKEGGRKERKEKQGGKERKKEKETFI